MPITLVTEQDQKTVLDEHNSTINKLEKIPIVPRNLNTGWPLLQVSLLSPSFDNETIKYEHALSGGKCHFFYIGAFNFANLLTKIPGKILITSRNVDKKIKKKQFIIDNVHLFLGGYEFHHKVIAINIAETSSGYGKSLNVEISEHKSAAFCESLRNSFEFALKPKSTLKNIGGWNDASSLNSEEIKNELNEEVAIFSNGQIFIDLGALIHSLKDDNLNLYFNNLFKIDAFLDLKKSYLEPCLVSLDNETGSTLKNPIISLNNHLFFTKTNLQQSEIEQITNSELFKN